VIKSETYEDTGDHLDDDTVLLGRNHHIIGEKSAQNEEHERHTHEDSRHSESQRITRRLVETLDVLSKDRRYKSGQKTAGVYGDVEQREELLQLLLHPGPKLVATKRGHT
jgi:hypothetical protein